MCGLTTLKRVQYGEMKNIAGVKEKTIGRVEVFFFKLVSTCETYGREASD